MIVVIVDIVYLRIIFFYKKSCSDKRARQLEFAIRIRPIIASFRRIRVFIYLQCIQNYNSIILFIYAPHSIMHFTDFCTSIQDVPQS